MPLPVILSINKSIGYGFYTELKMNTAVINNSLRALFIEN